MALELLPYLICSYLTVLILVMPIHADRGYLKVRASQKLPQHIHSFHIKGLIYFTIIEEILFIKVISNSIVNGNVLLVLEYLDGLPGYGVDEKFQLVLVNK